MTFDPLWLFNSVCFVGVPSECLKMAACDPTYACTILPTLQQKIKVTTADNQSKARDKLDSHMNMHLMKAMDILSAINATKGTRKGVSAGAN